MEKRTEALAKTQSKSKTGQDINSTMNKLEKMFRKWHKYSDPSSWDFLEEDELRVDHKLSSAALYLEYKGHINEFKGTELVIGFDKEDILSIMINQRLEGGVTRASTERHVTVTVSNDDGDSISVDISLRMCLSRAKLQYDQFKQMMKKRMRKNESIKRKTIDERSFDEAAG